MYDSLLPISVASLVLATHVVVHAACTGTSTRSGRLVRLIVVDIHHFVQLLLQAEALATEIADCLVFKRPLRIYLASIEVLVLRLDVLPEIGGRGRALLLLGLLTLRLVLVLILSLALIHGLGSLELALHLPLLLLSNILRITAYQVVAFLFMLCLLPTRSISSLSCLPFFVLVVLEAIRILGCSLSIILDDLSQLDIENCPGIPHLQVVQEVSVSRDEFGKLILRPLGNQTRYPLNVYGVG